MASLSMRGKTNRIYVSFSYKGKVIYEGTDYYCSNSKLSALVEKKYCECKSHKNAFKFAQALQYMIDLDKFDYTYFFPNGSNKNFYGNIGTIMPAKQDKDISLFDYIDYFLNNNDYKKVSNINYSIRLNKVKEYLKEQKREDIKVNEITEDIVKDILKNMKNIKRDGSKINNRYKEEILKTLRTLFFRAIKDEIIIYNPCINLSAADIIDLSLIKMSEKTLSVAEIEEMLANLREKDNKIKLGLAFVFYMGISPQDLLDLKWEDFDFYKYCLRIRETKLMPIPPILDKYIVYQYMNRGDSREYVFVANIKNGIEKPFRYTHCITRAWERIRSQYHTTSPLYSIGQASFKKNAAEQGIENRYIECMQSINATKREAWIAEYFNLNKRIGIRPLSDEDDTLIEEIINKDYDKIKAKPTFRQAELYLE